MSQAPPLRWAVVGPGAVADRFAASLRDSSCGSIAVVHGRRPERREEFCARHGGAAASTLAEALARDDVDAVYVASPHSAHEEAVAAALERGHPVLCEKPMTTSLAATRRLVELARSRRVPLVEAWMYRTHPQIRHVLDAVARDDFDLETVSSWFVFRVPYDPRHRLFDPDLGGGAILDVGGYPVSLALAVARAARRDGAARIVDARGKLAPNGVDLSSSAFLAIDDLLCGLEVGLEDDVETGCQIYDRNGPGVILDAPFVIPAGGDGRSATLGRFRDDERIETVTVASEHDCYALEAMAMNEIVAAGRLEASPPMVTLDESLEIARILEDWRAAITA